GYLLDKSKVYFRHDALKSVTVHKDNIGCAAYLPTSKKLVTYSVDNFLPEDVWFPTAAVVLPVDNADVTIVLAHKLADIEDEVETQTKIVTFSASGQSTGFPPIYSVPAGHI